MLAELYIKTYGPVAPSINVVSHIALKYNALASTTLVSG